MCNALEYSLFFVKRESIICVASNAPTTTSIPKIVVTIPSSLIVVSWLMEIFLIP